MKYLRCQVCKLLICNFVFENHVLVGNTIIHIDTNVEFYKLFTLQIRSLLSIYAEENGHY